MLTAEFRIFAQTILLFFVEMAYFFFFAQSVAMLFVEKF